MNLSNYNAPQWANELCAETTTTATISKKSRVFEYAQLPMVENNKEKFNSLSSSLYLYLFWQYFILNGETMHETLRWDEYNAWKKNP